MKLFLFASLLCCATSTAAMLVTRLSLAGNQLHQALRVAQRNKTVLPTRCYAQMTAAQYTLVGDALRNAKHPAELARILMACSKDSQDFERMLQLSTQVTRRYKNEWMQLSWLAPNRTKPLNEAFENFVRAQRNQQLLEVNQQLLEVWKINIGYNPVPAKDVLSTKKSASSFDPVRVLPFLFAGSIIGSDTAKASSGEIHHSSHSSLDENKQSPQTPQKRDADTNFVDNNQQNDDEGGNGDTDEGTDDGGGDSGSGD